jgi:hypothetical protein
MDATDLVYTSSIRVTSACGIPGSLSFKLMMSVESSSTLPSISLRNLKREAWLTSPTWNSPSSELLQAHRLLS